jgi:peptide/nickel transport system substrate-binding protein
MKTPRLASALRRLAAGAVLSAVLGATAYSARAETLVIGMTQFPSNFHPAIEAMLAKTMVLSAIRRPFVTHDQDWQPVCLLCTTFPTLDNGLAQRETLDGGGEGLAVTYTIQPEATWGDGRPVTADDVVFAWEMGRHPLSGVSDQEAFRRILSRGGRRQDLHPSPRPGDLRLLPLRARPAAGAHRPGDLRGRAGRIPQPHRL